MNAFSAKDPSEVITVAVDFVNLLGTSETLSTVVYSASVIQGIDPSPSSLISGSGTISGTKVLQNITGGLPGVTYLLTAKVTTSASHTFVASGLMFIQVGGA